MIKTLMYHKVEDFKKWKTAFDNFSEIRKSAGEKSFSIGNVQNEPNTAYVINTWDSMEAYQTFMDNPGLASAMKEAGVMEPPHTIVLNELEKGSLG